MPLISLYILQQLVPHVSVKQEVITWPSPLSNYCFKHCLVLHGIYLIAILQYMKTSSDWQCLPIKKILTFKYLYSAFGVFFGFTKTNSPLDAFQDSGQGSKHCLRELCQALLMKSLPFVFFSAGCALRVLIIVPLRLYFLAVSFMLEEG